MKNKKDSIIITELFMATAGGDFSRCFYGTIKRLTADNGIPYVLDRIRVENGFFSE